MRGEDLVGEREDWALVQTFLSPLPYREVARRLVAAGFTEATQRGSHVKFIKEDELGLRTVIVPHHREVAVGTLRSILRQAGLTPDRFGEL